MVYTLRVLEVLLSQNYSAVRYISVVVRNMYSSSRVKPPAVKTPIPADGSAPHPHHCFSYALVSVCVCSGAILFVEYSRVILLPKHIATSRLYEIRTIAAGRGCEVYELTASPHLTSGTIVPAGPHVHGLHPPNAQVTTFPKFLGRPLHLGRTKYVR